MLKGLCSELFIIYLLQIKSMALGSQLKSYGLSLLDSGI